MEAHSPEGIPKVSIKEAKTLLQLISPNITQSGKQAIMLHGPPGVGKSDLVRELAIETGREFVDIRLSTIDPVDLRGLPHIDPEEALTKWLPPDFLPQRHGNPGILFLDEINAAPPTIQASAYQLILDRKLGNYEVPDDWLVIAAGNRVSDRSVTYRLPSALANRFTHLEIIVNTEEWYQWAWKNDIDPLIIGFLRHHPQLLLKFDPDSSDLAFPTPRSWAFASSFQDVRDVNPRLYLKGLQGTIGMAATQQFLAFLKHGDDLPSPKDILSGKPVDYPHSPDAQYVMLGSLIQHLLGNPNAEKISHYFDYVNYYEDSPYADYAVMLVKELVTAFQSSDKTINNNTLSEILLDHTSYKEWVNRNTEVLS